MTVAPSPYTFSFLPAPADLQPYVNALYLFGTEREMLVESLPAYSAQLAIFVTGSTEIDLPNPPVGEVGDIFFLAPQMKASPFVAYGPVHGVGVSFTAQGWAALAGRSVDECHSCQLAPDACLPEDMARRLDQLLALRREGQISDAALAEGLADAVRAGITPLSERHTALLRTTFQWLGESWSPRVEDLYARLPFSQRQAQRLIVRFFGQPPATLMRRYRAIRAATFLSMPQVPPFILEQIRDAYYDQAHFIRDIREFTGRTPSRLGPDEETVIKDMLSPAGHGLVDPFAATVNEQPCE
ncbi:MAG: helix-turn-helix domain-containing protein [Sphingomonadaceae bacterium]|nr:helix-turn-helix domain-containing protein [Sphingomonadaceae bacterium]